MPGYGDVIDLFDGTFDHHLPSATSADKYGDDLAVLEIYINGANIVLAFASHEFVDLILMHSYILPIGSNWSFRR